MQGSVSILDLYTKIERLAMTQADEKSMQIILCSHESMTSSHYVDTFITGNSENEKILKITVPHSGTQQLVSKEATTTVADEIIKPVADVDSSSSAGRQKSTVVSGSTSGSAFGRHSPRRAITEAIESMERETNELRESNRRLNVEASELRRENVELHRQLEQSRRERTVVERRVDELRRDVDRLDAEIDDRKREFEMESLKVADKERRLRDAIVQCEELRAELDRNSADWKSFVERHNEEMRAAVVDRDALKVRLEQLTVSTMATASAAASKRKDAQQKGGVDAAVVLELQHALEAMKRDRREMAAVRDQLTRDNRKLTVELQNLTTVLADRENELRKERTRHVLLTRQFNSLLDENTTLKEKRQVKSVQQVTQINHVPDAASDSSFNFIAGTCAGVRTSATKTSSGGSPDVKKNRLNVEQEVKSTQGSVTSSPPPSRLSRETARDLGGHVASSRGRTPEVADRCITTPQRQQREHSQTSSPMVSSRTTKATSISFRRINVTPSVQRRNSISMATAATATNTPEPHQLPTIQSADSSSGRKWLP